MMTVRRSARSLRSTLFTLAAGLFAVAPALSAALAPPAAYPIDPVPLRQLWALSDLVVVAEVVEERAATEDEPGARRARLAVQQVLRGRAEAEVVVEIYGFICPAPASYTEGRRVLAFLARPELPGDAPEGTPTPEGYWTVGLSYGSKTLGEDVLAAHVRALRELARLEAITDADVRHAGLSRWLVDLVADPLTRTEGLLDLNTNRHKRGREPRDPVRIQRFPDAQVDRLVQLFEGLAPDDRDLMDLARILKAAPHDSAHFALRDRLELLRADPEVSDKLVTRFENLCEEG